MFTCFGADPAGGSVKGERRIASHRTTRCWSMGMVFSRDHCALGLSGRASSESGVKVSSPLGGEGGVVIAQSAGGLGEGVGAVFGAGRLGTTVGEVGVDVGGDAGGGSVVDRPQGAG